MMLNIVDDSNSIVAYNMQMDFGMESKWIA